MTERARLDYPERFRGLFTEVRAEYVPLLEDARDELSTLSIPGELRPFFDYVVRDNPQPSFMLLPLLFLFTAEQSGGIAAAHRRYLPVMMLGMEIVAICDDTVDRTPSRSGRPTFPARFGEGSSTPFTAALMAMVAERARRVDARILEVTMRFFVDLFANELWERHHLYPGPELFDRWLGHRYRQSEEGASFALNTALLLNDRAPLSTDATAAFGRVFQDVDDVVSLLEERDAQGENDDVTMGMVTRPLLDALAARPALLEELLELWTVSRALGLASIADQARERERLGATIAARAHPILASIVELGVPKVVERVLQDCRACVEASPPSLRRVTRRMTSTFADRLRRCGTRELLSEDQIAAAFDDLEGAQW